ncbi:MAG: U4/U6 small nuclear ribonucleoprotein Prp31 [Paramarteilia canceri]
MSFGNISEDVTQIEVGKDYGTLGSNKSGKVRLSQVDGKTKSKMSKSMQQKLQKEISSANATFSRVGGNATVLKQQLQKSSGSASSVISFTPLQGLEIVVDQNANKESEENQDGYFSSLAQFKAPRK